jgi:hypothetical protein
MARYKIISKVNPYIAQRLFNGKTRIVLDSDLSLKQAQNELSEFYCEDHDECCGNWGLIRMHDPDTWSHHDGTRGYEYDSRQYYIEIEEEMITDYGIIYDNN